MHVADRRTIQRNLWRWMHVNTVVKFWVINMTRIYRIRTPHQRVWLRYLEPALVQHVSLKTHTRDLLFFAATTSIFVLNLDRFTPLNSSTHAYSTENALWKVCVGVRCNNSLLIA